MLGLKMDPPANCMYCPVRMNCQLYLDWLRNYKKKRPESNMFKDGCLLVDLDYMEDDLK